MTEYATEAYFPEEAKRMKEAYNKGGSWIRDKVKHMHHFRSNGMWMLRVTLWKLQTAVHRDINDELCLLFCVGEFEGGEGIFPDLKLKVR